MASAAMKALKEVSTAFEEGLLDEEHYNAFRNLFVESRTRMLESEGRGGRGEAVGDRKVDEVLPSASLDPEEPELTMVEENTKASSEGPSVPRTPELVGPILRAPISPAPRPRRVRSSPVFFDPVPSKRVKRAREEPKERAKSKVKSKSPTHCRETGCYKVKVFNSPSPSPTYLSIYRSPPLKLTHVHTTPVPLPARGLPEMREGEV